MTNNIFLEYGNNPFDLFAMWFLEAKSREPNDPNAMALATVSESGRPQVRIVLLKNFDERGFTFFTNMDSAKGDALEANPFAELNFHWKSLEKQIRISGPVVKTTDMESDEYFASRRRENQLGAWASNQSRPLDTYEDFEKRVKKMEKKFEGGTISRPPHWGGFRVIPERMEFWIGHVARLHKRFVYIKNGKDWTANWLFP